MEQKVIRREKWIDVAKVIAILIVLLNHSGIVIPGVNFWGGMFFVSAFFLLAGYTYSSKDETYGSFVKRKAKRLLVPYFIANFLLMVFFVMKDLLTGSFAMGKTLLSLLGIFYGRNQLFVNGYFAVFDFDASLLEMITSMEKNVYLMTNLNSPTWFLPALFLTLICGEAIYRKSKGKYKTIAIILAVLFALAVLYHWIVPVLLPWSLDALPCFLIFFFVGYALKDTHWFEMQAEKPLGKRLCMIFLLVFALFVSGMLNGSFNLSIRAYGRNIILCMIAAITSSMLIMYVSRFMEHKLPRVADAVGKVGKYTLTILCYHYFIFQMFIIVMMALLPGQWGDNALWYVITIAGMVVSVVACVLADIVVKKCTRR